MDEDFSRQTRRFSAAILTDCKGKRRSMAGKRLARQRSTVVNTGSKGENPSDELEAELTLYQGDTYVDSWSNSGAGPILVSGNCTVKSGRSYRLVLTWSISGSAKSPVTVAGTCRFMKFFCYTGRYGHSPERVVY